MGTWRPRSPAMRERSEFSMLLKSLRIDGLLSFAPGTPAIDLLPLNVLIGPNASGKTNLIEAIELLRATPKSFSTAIREGGGVREWLWKGQTEEPASIEVHLSRESKNDLRYLLEFTASGDRLEITDETLEDVARSPSGSSDAPFYYRFQGGNPVINVVTEDSDRVHRKLKRDSLAPDASVLAQRKDPDLYPELSWIAEAFARIQIFREWRFGCLAEVRKPQPTTLPTDFLLPDATNLSLILNRVEHSSAGPMLQRVLKRFLPRFERYSTLTSGGTIQFFFHEDTLSAPIPAARLSDGTIRFLAMSALLLTPNPPPLLCIEEPELGLHPDALAIIADLLIEASERTQIILTTHSDALLSHLSISPQSVLVCENLNGTMTRRLNPDDLTSWLEDYRLGELWRNGAIGGNP